MYQMINSGQSSVEMRVFREAGSALKWLDREELDIESICDEIRSGAKGRS